MDILISLASAVEIKSVIVLTVCCMAEFYMICEYYSYYNEKRDFVNRRLILLMMVIYLAMGILTQQSLLYPEYFVLTVTGCILIRIILYKGGLVSYIKDSIVVILCIVAAKESFRHYFNFIRLKDDGCTYDLSYLLLLLTIGASMLSYILLRGIRQIRGKAYRRIFWCYMIIPAATIINIICTPYIYINEFEADVMDFISLIIQTVIYVGSFVLFHFYDQYSRAKEQEIINREMSVKYGEQEKYYREIKEKNQKYAVMVHNMRHYLRELNRHADFNNMGDVEKILEELKGEFEENKNQEICYYPLLNSILTDYRERAEDNNIDINIFVEEAFNIDYMRRIDIIGMFGNVLENAVEAAGRCENGKIAIKLFMQNDGCYSVINVKNTFEGNVKTDGEKLLTTKKNNKEHGIGTQNIRDIVYKYDGYISQEYEDGIFYTSILIPVK